MVRPGFCGCVCTRLDLRIPTGSLAFWIGRGHLDTDSDQAVVVNEESENEPERIRAMLLKVGLR